jgi:hypothetical protein
MHPSKYSARRCACRCVCVCFCLTMGCEGCTLLFGSPGRQVRKHAFVHMHPVCKQVQRMMCLSLCLRLCLLDDGLLDFTLLFGSPGRQVRKHACMHMHLVY